MSVFPFADRFREFQRRSFRPQQWQYAHLAANGQSPEVMVIACCDSRVHPETIFDAAPGEIFAVRNVANLVPPYETSGIYHGVSAAVEFAVLNLHVRHIIVLGHSQCGGINACLHNSAKGTFVGNWMSMLDAARDALPHPDNKSLEYAGIINSIKNLRSFPELAKAEAEGTLFLHGAHFDIASGILNILDEKTGNFSPLEQLETATPMKAGI